MTLPCSVDELRSRLLAGERFDYLHFWGHRPRPDGVSSSSCLSQWYGARFEVDGIAYRTAEQYMMAEKARLFGDQATLERILAADTLAAAKAHGRSVARFHESTWDSRRFEIVVSGNLAKFGQNPALSEFLRGTGDKVLVEASPVDPVWGIGLAADDPAAQDPASWRGLNLLGFALMAVRERIASPPT